MVTTKNRRASRHGRALAVLLTIGLAAAGTAGPAAGRTIGVPGDAPSIKGAMIRARAGDIILVSCGTYREHDIIVKPGVSLWSGTLQPDCAVIDAGGRGRCLIFPAGADTTTRVVGFTLRGGTALGEGLAGQEEQQGCEQCERLLHW